MSVSPLTTPPSHRGSKCWREVDGLIPERDAVGAVKFVVQQETQERLAPGRAGNGQQFPCRHFVGYHGEVSLCLFRRGLNYF